MKLAEASELWLLERARKLPSVVSVGSSSTSPRVASVTSSAPPSVLKQSKKKRKIKQKANQQKGAIRKERVQPQKL